VSAVGPYWVLGDIFIQPDHCQNVLKCYLTTVKVCTSTLANSSRSATVIDEMYRHRLYND